MRGDVSGAVECRRRWTDAEKFVVVCEVGRHGASVTQVAQRHDLSRPQIYTWRHDLRKKGLRAPEGAALFLPVELASPKAPKAKVAGDDVAPMMEVVLRNGRQTLCRSGTGDDDLAQLIRLVEAARIAWLEATETMLFSVVMEATLLSAKPGTTPFTEISATMCCPDAKEIMSLVVETETIAMSYLFDPGV